MILPLRSVSALFVASCVVAAACGGGGGSSPTSPSTAATPTTPTTPTAPTTPTVSWSSEGTRISGTDAGLSSSQVFADVTVIRLNDGRWRMYMFAGNAYRSAISSDGLSFAMESGNRMREGAGQSRAIRLDDGRIRMFFSSGSGLGSMISTDDGTTFTEESGMRLSNSAAGVSGITGPGIVKMSGGLYRMYFSDLPIPGEGVKAHLIKSATSADLLTWTMDGGVRIGAGAALTGNAEHPCAIVNAGGSVTIFYFRNTDFGLYQATSTDGLTFTTEQSTGFNTFNDPDIVTLPSGSVRLYMGTIGASGGYIASATRATANFRALFSR